MGEKPILYYFNGRGRMESIRWLLAVSEVEFEEVLLTKREQYEQLLKDGALMFHQVPLVEIDGMKLVQTKAIINYIAGKYNLIGNNIKERAMIDMYADGVRDLMEMIMMLPFIPPENLKNKLDAIHDKAVGRYLPVYEKVLSGSQYLVANHLSYADVHLFEVMLMLEEKFPTILANFPSLQAFQSRMKELPGIKKFLLPSSQRKPPPGDLYVKTVKEVLNI